MRKKKDFCHTLCQNLPNIHTSHQKSYINYFIKTKTYNKINKI